MREGIRCLKNIGGNGYANFVSGRAITKSCLPIGNWFGNRLYAQIAKSELRVMEDILWSRAELMQRVAVIRAPDEISTVSSIGAKLANAKVGDAFQVSVQGGDGLIYGKVVSIQ